MTDEQMDARLHAAGQAWRENTERPAPVTATAPPPPTAPPLPTAPAGRPPRHRTAWLASAAVLLTALVAGGSFLLGRTSTSTHQHRTGTAAAESNALEGRTWRLLNYGSDPVRGNSYATLVIGHDGTLVADDTCNLYTAKADTADGVLRVSHPVARYYGCTDAVGEVTFDTGIDLFAHDPAWSVDGERLTISGDGGTMHLVAAPDLPAPIADRPTLTGATWRLTAAADAHGTQHAVASDRTGDLRIDGGQLSASDTCNSISGPATVTGGILHVGDLAITAVGCIGDSTPAIVDEVLTNGARFQVAGAALTVTQPGKGTLTYRWQPDDQQATNPARLAATPWRLRSVAGESAATDVTLTLSGSTLRLATACETVDATVTIAAGSATVTGVPEQPKAGCPAQLTTVHSFLASAPVYWHIVDGRLVVNQLGAQAFALVFDPTQDVPAAAVELPGTWTLTSIEQDSGNSASGSGSSASGITLKITAGATRYEISSSCLNMNGPLNVSGDRITIGDSGVAGYGGCDELTKAVKTVFTGGPMTWTLQDGHLQISRDQTKLTFER